MLAKYYRSKSHPQGELKEGIAYSERKKSFGEGSLAENKETGRCIVCYFVSYFMILMHMNSSSSYCTISFNSSVTRHAPSKIDEMSRWSRSFWRSDEIFFR